MADSPSEVRGLDALIALSAAIASRDESQVGEALDRAGTEAEHAAVEEVLLQSHLFVGFPAALEAMTAWRARHATPAAVVEGSPVSWIERGEATCAVVYGASYERLRERVAGLHPDLDRWMVETGYGRVIGRPGLALAARELCIVALLAVWNAPRQLHSHLLGALRAGARPVEVERALEIACQRLDPVAAAQVRDGWRNVRARDQGEISPTKQSETAESR